MHVDREGPQPCKRTHVAAAREPVCLACAVVTRPLLCADHTTAVAAAAGTAANQTTGCALCCCCWRRWGSEACSTGVTHSWGCCRHGPRWLASIGPWRGGCLGWPLGLVGCGSSSSWGGGAAGCVACRGCAACFRACDCQSDDHAATATTLLAELLDHDGGRSRWDLRHKGRWVTVPVSKVWRHYMSATAACGNRGCCTQSRAKGDQQPCRRA